MTTPPQLALVIVADDFGYCPERCAAIVQLYRLGAISTTSIIVNSHSSELGAGLASANGLPVGLHFNITEGKPTCNEDVSTLCDRHGTFLGKFGLRDAVIAGHVDLDHVTSELRSQIALCKAWFGRVPSHVDGHQHVHVIPGICDKFASVLATHGIRWTRLPVESSLDNIAGQPRRFYQDVVAQSKMAAKVFDRYGIRFASQFFGMSTMGKEMTMSRIRKLLPGSHASATSESQDRSHIPSGESANRSRADSETANHGTGIGRDAIEWMVHPGFPPGSDSPVFGEGPDQFASSSERQYEFDFLANPALRKLLVQRNIHLCSFDQISD